MCKLRKDVLPTTAAVAEYVHWPPGCPEMFTFNYICGGGVVRVEGKLA